MEILNTGWIFPSNAETVICVIGSLVLIGMLIYLIAVGTTDGFSITIISWLIAIACVVSVLLVILFDNRETTYSIYPGDMTLKELETEYEPYNIDGLILKCTKIKKGEKK